MRFTEEHGAHSLRMGSANNYSAISDRFARWRKSLLAAGITFILTTGATTFSGILFSIACPTPASAAAPPVRIGVVTGGGSGIEQEIVDRISMQLEENPDVKVSTVNPDWYVVCNIKEFMDQVSGQIRYNGNVIIKTQAGSVIDTVAVQQYKQDFSLTPGMPLNKALVDRAAREAISGAADRAVPKIEQAARVEMETRAKIIRAQMMAEQEQFEGAINILRQVSPDSPHFNNVRDLIDEFHMEAESLAKIKQAEEAAAQKKYSNAIATLGSIAPKSRYKAKANQLINTYKAASRPAPAKITPKPKSASSQASAKPANKTAAQTDKSDLKALDKMLEIEKKAIEDTQAKVREQLKQK